MADSLHQWLVGQRSKVPEGSATARAIDYSLKRWVALTRFIDGGDLPIDNNWVENQIRPIAIDVSMFPCCKLGRLHVTAVLVGQARLLAPQAQGPP